MEPIIQQDESVYFVPTDEMVIDEMDARVNQIQASIENDIQQGNWTSLQNYFRTALWKKD